MIEKIVNNLVKNLLKIEIINFLERLNLYHAKNDKKAISKFIE